MNRFPRNKRTYAGVVAALLLVVLATMFALAQRGTRDAGDNPVVIRLGATTEQLDELNERFEIAIRSLAANRGMQLNDELRDQLYGLRPQFLEQRATELVLLNEADKRDLQADPAEVDAAVERIRANAGSDEAFDALIEQAGFPGEERLRELIAESLRVDAAVNALRDSIDIGEGELRTFYQANKAQFGTPEEVCASHILLESEADAQAVLEDLEGGADFAEMAREHSTGPSGPNGGDLGCFTRGRMVAPFEEAAFDAPVGEAVGPVETQFGFHLIRVSERNPASTPSFDEVRGQIEPQVRDQQLQQRIEALRRGAGVITYPDRLDEPNFSGGATPAEDAPAEQAPNGEDGSDDGGAEGSDEGGAEDSGEDSGEGSGEGSEGGDSGN